MEDSEDSEENGQNKLHQLVISHSIGKTWISAKQEWRLISIYDADSYCICGHSIRENCIIRNKNNDKELIVGNVCVNQFNEKCLTISHTARQSLTKLNHSVTTKRANKDLVEIALRLGILSKAEHDRYCKETNGKNSRNCYNMKHADFNRKKLEFRTKINMLIHLGFSIDRPLCQCAKPELSKPRQNSQNKTYFYSCSRWPDGCKFTQSSKIKCPDIVDYPKVKKQEHYTSQEGKNNYTPIIVSISQKWKDSCWEGYDDDEEEEDRETVCGYCHGSTVAYLSDDLWGPCFECSDWDDYDSELAKEM